jgi:hypothetical protein
VGENSIISDAVAKCDARNSVNEDRMLRVEHKIVNVFDVNRLGHAYIGRKAPRLAARHTNRMPRSDEEATR